MLSLIASTQAKRKASIKKSICYATRRVSKNHPGLAFSVHIHFSPLHRTGPQPAYIRLHQSLVWCQLSHQSSSEYRHKPWK